MSHPLSEELRKLISQMSWVKPMDEYLPPSDGEMKDALRRAADALDEQVAGRKRALDLGNQAADAADSLLGTLEILTAERDELRQRAEELERCCASCTTCRDNAKVD